MKPTFNDLRPINTVARECYGVSDEDCYAADDFFGPDCDPEQCIGVDLGTLARGEFPGEDDETDICVPLPPRVPMKCWRCDAVRDCGFDLCPHCQADPVPF